jgi:hypothetical protein
MHYDGMLCLSCGVSVIGERERAEIFSLVVVNIFRIIVSSVVSGGNRDFPNRNASIDAS